MPSMNSLSRQPSTSALTTISSTGSRSVITLSLLWRIYRTELELFDREKVKHFIQRLLEKVQNSKNVPNYKYVLFDCPPSFSLLSYSVLSCCNLVLIPINPDFFAAKGLSLLLSSLRMRIEPFPVPRIGVFMNRAKKTGWVIDKTV
ncbi:MAG: AAA family ATPase [Bryobacteraceae bacterium]